MHPRPVFATIRKKRARRAARNTATSTVLMALLFIAGCGGQDAAPAPPAPMDRIAPLDTGAATAPAPAPDPATVRMAQPTAIASIALPPWDGMDMDGSPFDLENQVSIGAPRPLEDFADLSPWLHFNPTARGTQVAALSVTSPEARGLRLGLQIDQLPPEATLRFYAPGVRETVQVSARDIAHLRQVNLDAGTAPDIARVYWSPEFGTEHTVLEIELPAAAAPAEVQIGLPRVSHFLRTMSESRQVPKRLTQSCAIDVSCTPENLEQGRATARIGFVNEDGEAGVCSGTLLNDRASSGTPYFLTAEHCMENQAWASTLEIDWFFRSASCGADTLDAVAQRQRGGAVLLYRVSADQDDVAFLRLNRQPPVGVVYAGSWLGEPMGPGEPLTDVHHGAGDAQSFSAVRLKNYCEKEGYAACEASPTEQANYLRVVSERGFLPGGASGSGLFRGIGGQRYLVGALSGAETAYDACDGSGKPLDAFTDPVPPGERIDYFSRFDRAYHQALHQWLAP